MKIRGYDTTRAQGGWVCDTCFTVQTVRQFTPEEHTIRTGGRWMWLAMLRGFLQARQSARHIAVSAAAEFPKLGG